MSGSYRRVVLAGPDATVTVTISGDDAIISYSDSTRDARFGREEAEEQIATLLACGYTIREGRGFASQG